MSVSSEFDEYREKIINMTKNSMMSEYTRQMIVQRLTEKDLMKLDKIMKKNPYFNITTFLRIFRIMLRPSEEEDFYLTYALFKLFQQICLACKNQEVSFNDINSIITQKMPSINHDIHFSEKLYPLGFQVPESIKKKISAPEVVGKVLEQRQRLQEQPYLNDKFIHFNRKVGQSFYSTPNRMFITVDNASTDIMLLDDQLQLIKIIRTDQELAKRDAIITCIAWSEHQQQLAALLGNYSLSLWAREDHFRFQVNIPIPLSLMLNPYVAIGYMQSSRLWYAIGNRPTIYILSSKDYQPQYTFTHFKMIKENQSQKIMTVELKYRKLLGIAFQNNIFLVSLEKRELVNQIKSFSTYITCLAFSQTYQALFVSTFQNVFYSFELTDHLDLTPKGKFQGHKSFVSIVGVLENRPVMYSIDESSVTRLWDIRDFTCYQTFTSIKNIQFSQTLALPDGICLIGSKHFCYRWQRFRSFQEIQRIIYITQLQKNILLVTSKEIRVYSHNNGVLIRVLKGVFNKESIVKAHLIDIRKMLMLVNQEGLAKVYFTKDFSFHTTFQFPPKPLSIFYEKETELFTISCMGEIRINEFKDTVTLPLKRRIHNRQDILKICEISPSHDFLVLQYDLSPYLVFYSYERAKFEGYLVVEEVIKVKFVQNKNIFFVLCKQKLLICTYNKTIHSTSFFIKSSVDLWQPSQIKAHRIVFYFKPFTKIESTDLVIFQNKIFVTSNDACFQCSITIDSTLLNSQQTKISRQNYNPYRIASEDFLQSFDIKKKSVVIEQQIEKLVTQKKYIKYPGQRIFVYLTQISLFYCIADEKQIIFYDQHGNIRGTIDFKQTLPSHWDLHNYSEEEFKELEFVLQFVQRDPKEQNDQDNFYLASSILSKANSKMEDKSQVITLGMLGLSGKLKGVRSTSLREKKMILEKERDQLEKQENFQELRKAEEIAKLNSLHISSNQRYMGESLAFLNVNRNKLLLTKGVPEPELPQIRALEFKLNAMMNKDEKKSIVSKYSGGQETTPVRQAVQLQLTKSLTKTTADLRLLQDKQQKESYKDQIKRLDMSLRQSKYKKTHRSSSLPVLRRT